MPTAGLENFVRRLMNSGLSLSGDTAPDIADIPYIRTAKPRRISPTCLVELFFAAILITIPIRAVTPVRTAVLKRAAMRLNPKCC